MDASASFCVVWAREPTSGCHHCDGSNNDTAQHTLEVCSAWEEQCCVLVMEIGAPGGGLKSDIDELNTLLKQATRKRVQDLLTLEIRKLEAEWISMKEHEDKAATPSVPTTSVSAPAKRYQIKLNGYGWDQSDKYIKVFVTLKNVQNLPKDQVYCKLTDKSMELHVENLDGKDYLLVINKLLEPISVEGSHWKQKTDMVVIFLAKSHPNIKWSHMTELEKKFEDQRNSRFKPDEMDKKDPQESIMSLMKNMYETGDDEMKRMISKAWYEGQNKKKTDTIDL